MSRQGYRLAKLHRLWHGLPFQHNLDNDVSTDISGLILEANVAGVTGLYLRLPLAHLCGYLPFESLVLTGDFVTNVETSVKLRAQSGD